MGERKLWKVGYIDDAGQNKEAISVSIREDGTPKFMVGDKEGGGGGAAYTAGHGIQIVDNTIQTDENVVQDKLPINGTDGDVLTQECKPNYINGNIPSIHTEVNAIYVSAENLINNVSKLFSSGQTEAELFNLYYNGEDDEELNLFIYAFGGFTDARFYDDNYAGIYLTSGTDLCGFIINTNDYPVTIDHHLIHDWDNITVEAKTAYWVMLDDSSKYVLFKFPDNENLITWYQNTFNITLTKSIYLGTIYTDVETIKNFVSINNPYEVQYDIKYKWAPSITPSEKNNDVLTTVINPAQKSLKASYSIEELENFYGDLDSGQVKGIVSTTGDFIFEILPTHNEDEPLCFVLLLYQLAVQESCYEYKCNEEDYEDGWYLYDGSEYEKIDYIPELIIPENLTSDDFQNISDVSEMDVLLNNTPGSVSIEWRQGMPKNTTDNQAVLANVYNKNSVGTPVIPEQPLTKVYFNTAKSAKEVEEILSNSNLNYSELPGLDDTYALLYVSEDFDMSTGTGMGIAAICFNEGDAYGIGLMTSNGMSAISASSRAWSQDVFENNSNYLSVPGPSLSAYATFDVQGWKIPQLFASKQFEKVNAWIPIDLGYTLHIWAPGQHFDAGSDGYNHILLEGIKGFKWVTDEDFKDDTNATFENIKKVYIDTYNANWDTDASQFLEISSTVYAVSPNHDLEMEPVILMSDMNLLITQGE